MLEITRTLTEIGAALGAISLIAQIAKSWRARRRVIVSVNWNSLVGVYGSKPSLKIFMVNPGAAAIHIRQISLRAGKSDVPISTDGITVDAGDSWVFIAELDDDLLDQLSMSGEKWAAMRIVVWDIQGKDWKSQGPKEKPSWLNATSYLRQTNLRHLLP